MHIPQLMSDVGPKRILDSSARCIFGRLGCDIDSSNDFMIHIWSTYPLDGQVLDSSSYLTSTAHVRAIETDKSLNAFPVS